MANLFKEQWAAFFAQYRTTLIESAFLVLGIVLGDVLGKLL